MNTEILGIIAMFAITLVIGIFLGKYIADIYGHKKTFLDKIFQPIDYQFLNIALFQNSDLLSFILSTNQASQFF